jgi:glycerophosphoryl diester phosphodiesterase
MIGFAHRGAPALGVRENSLPAFSAALAKGATALESDVWLTADGVPVLHHDGVLRAGLRRRPIGALAVTALPGWLPSLDGLYTQLGASAADVDLSLDVKDPAAALPAMQVAARHAATERLWLCGTTPQVRQWRESAQTAVPPVPVPRLVVSTTLRGNGSSPQQRIAEAADAGADALNLRNPEWTAERVALCHERGMLAFAWDVQRAATLQAVRDFGCDAIFSDHVALLTRL